MKTDGKFIIESGGITQGIQKELGLSNEECKELQKNSVWNEIIKELEDPNNLEEVINNNGITPSKSNNYAVYKNAVIKFAEASWKRIVDLVNKTLNKNIEIDNEASKQNDLVSIISALDNMQLKEEKEEDINEFPVNIKDDIIKYTRLNNINYINQKAVKIGNEWFDFDKKGRVERVYAVKPNGLQGEKANSYVYIVYDEQNNVSNYLTYKNKGALNSDGTKTVLEYDREGKMLGMFNLEAVNSDVSKIAQDILSQANTLNKESLYEILDRIDNIETLGKGVYGDHPKLYHFFVNYSKISNESFLESLAKIEPNGKELADMIINKVRTKEAQGDEFTQKYLDDIYQDMESHRDDYHKLTIDLMRMMKRGTIDPEGTIDIDNTPIKYDTTLESNGELDERVEQKAGDCWLIASLLSISDPKRNPNGRAYIKSLISHDTENHTFTVELKGIGRSYTFSEDEVLKSNHLSKGDDDLRIIEIAFDKYRRDMAYERSSELQYSKVAIVDIEAGCFSEVMNVLYGNKGNEYNSANFDITIFNKKNTANAFVFSETGNYEETSIMATNSSGKQIALFDTHQYNIVGCDEKYVYFTNPHNTNPDDIKNNNIGEDSTILKLPIQEFLKLKNLKVSSFELPNL